MRAHGVLGEHLGMTLPTVHRIEPTFVPSRVGADVTGKAFGRAVNGALKLSEVDLVAIIAGGFFLNVGRLQRERQAREKKCEGYDGIAHGAALGFAVI